jgi:hypothetical protein
VAGRCVAQGATAAIDGARRLLFVPVDRAYVHRSTPPHAWGQALLETTDVRGASLDEAVATLGRADDEGAALLLRFAIPLPRETSVLEAYLLLERTADTDGDPGSIALSTLRVVEPWDGSSVSWRRPPRMEPPRAGGSPVTRVSRGVGRFVRLDVRDLVQGWRKREADEFGLAIVARGSTVSGCSFAWQPQEEFAGPRLELYVR